MNTFEQQAAQQTRRVRAGSAYIDTCAVPGCHIEPGKIEQHLLPVEFADEEPLTMVETLALLAIGIVCVGVAAGFVIAIATR